MPSKNTEPHWTAGWQTGFCIIHKQQQRSPSEKTCSGYEGTDCVWAIGQVAFGEEMETNNAPR